LSKFIAIVNELLLHHSEIYGEHELTKL